MAELPSGTVSFLFTDMEGSTRLWEEHPELMRPTLARHDEIVRAAIESHGGYVVKTTGDGFHAAFATAADAVDAAIVAQQALTGEPWAEATPLRVRVGIHTGAAEIRDGDYYGSAVNRAARIMSVAHGGQILVSAATSALVQDDAIELVDLGEHRLRDLTVSERVFQVRAPGLVFEFPPLRSLDAFPGNLPLQVTSFVGRSVELGLVVDALRATRVVTLTGVGGVGKTRLALQVAADVLPRYRDGAWFCELALVGEPDAIGEALAGALDLQPRIGQPLDDTVFDFLRSKELLLVLDNCEHVLDGVARVVDRIVQSCAKVTVLATSREGLALAGERLVALPSLGVPESGAPIDAEALVGLEAIALFAERAADARAGFVLNAGNAEAVVQVCRRLDGIPLAIELAAARITSMTPAEIAARLDDQFRLLAAGRRTAVERHQTLRRAVDWSYDLLTPREQRVLERLSVFAGGCTLRAAEAVISDDHVDVLDVFEDVDGLVRRSLVVADAVGGDTRYRLLETIRQYAQDRLEEGTEAEAFRRRHAEYFSGVAVAAGPRLRGREQLACIAELMPDLDNLRTAFAWAVDHGDLTVAVPMVVATCINGISLGYTALAWAELAAGMPGLDGYPLGAALLAQAAWSAVLRGAIDEAEALDARRVAAEISLALPPNAANFQAPATIALFSGRMDDAAACARDWFAVARAAGDGYEAVQGLNMLSAALNTDDDALRTAEEALEEARRLGNPSILSWTLTGCGLVLLNRGEPARAVEVLTEAVAAGVEVGNRQGVAASLMAIGGGAFLLGDHRRAVRAFADAFEQQVELGDRFMVATTISSFAMAASDLGDHERSAVLHGIGPAMNAQAWYGTFGELMAESLAAVSAALGEARFDELRHQRELLAAEDPIPYVREQFALALEHP